jgi:hypothetical protein
MSTTRDEGNDEEHLGWGSCGARDVRDRPAEVSERQNAAAEPMLGDDINTPAGSQASQAPFVNVNE